MSKEKLTSKQKNMMYFEILKDLAESFIILLITITTLFGFVKLYDNTISMTMSGPLLFGVIGVLAAFTGSSMMTDALKRWGGHTLPQWRFGKKLEVVGLALTVLALLLS